MRDREPGSLFPGLPVLIVEILVHGYSPLSVTTTGHDFDEVVDVLSAQRLAALALRFCRDRHIELKVDTKRRLMAAAFQQSLSTQQVMIATVPGLELLRRQEIPFLVTKGQSIAVLHPQATDRPFTDLDIMVPRRKLRRARLVLSAGDHYAEARRSLLPRESAETWCREAVNLEAPTGGRLDLHHRIPPWIWGAGLTYQLLSGQSRSVDLSGFSAECVSVEHNLLIAALHVLSDKNQAGQNLMAWRDVIVLGHQVDPQAAVKAASEAGLAAWLRWVLTSLPPAAQPTDLVEELRAAGGQIHHRLRLRLIRSRRVASRSTAIHMLRLPVPNALLYILTLSFPSKTFLRAKYPDRVGKLYRRWLRDSVRL